RRVAVLEPDRNAQIGPCDADLEPAAASRQLERHPGRRTRLAAVQAAYPEGGRRHARAVHVDFELRAAEIGRERGRVDEALERELVARRSLRMTLPVEAEAC